MFCLRLKSFNKEIIIILITFLIPLYLLSVRIYSPTHHPPQYFFLYLIHVSCLYYLFTVIKYTQKLMFSCWNYCGNEGEDDNTIIVRGFDESTGNLVRSRASRNNKKQMQDFINQTVHYTKIRASNYDALLQQCKTNRTNFLDRNFPPNEDSLNFRYGNRKIVWKRILDVVENAVMVEGNIEPEDVQQGNIGDCYFLASISSIAENPERISRIFDHNMQISKEGIYKLIICQQGQPKEVVIDDYVPVFEGSNRPVFCKPNNNQIWVMLLEKAWAKICGSYGDTSSGYPHEVLNTFLVAPCFYEDIQLQLLDSKEQKNKLWEKLFEAETQGFAMCAGSRSSRLCQGIKPSHTYSLLGAYQVRNSQQNHITRIVKLRNPWGDTEYSGRYSEHDKNFWSQVDPGQQKKIFHRRYGDDGIFTLELDEFIRNFESLDISHDRKSFSYDLQKMKIQANKENYLAFNTYKDGECYFTVEKNFTKHKLLKENSESEYGYIRLLLFKEVQSQNSKQYQYIDSKLEPNFPDATLKQKLKAGRYMIMIQASFQNNKPQQYLTISVYSSFKAQIERIPKPDPLLFHKVFMEQAQHDNQNKKTLGSNDCWTISRFMYEEGGFGYIAAHLSNTSPLKLKILCDVRKVMESGFRILEKGENRGYLEIDLDSEYNDEILIFAVDFTRKKQEIRFPPKGVKVTRII